MMDAEHNRSAAHDAAVIAIELEMARAGLRPRHTCQTNELKPGEFQTYKRRRMAGDAMPCDLVAYVGRRLVFVKAANVRTNFTSSHRFIAYAGEAGHDYLIVTTGRPVADAMRAKFPGVMAGLDAKPTIARVIHVSQLGAELRTLAGGKQPRPRRASQSPTRKESSK